MPSTRKIATVGTKAQVFHGTAKHTSGGLTKKDLMQTKKGRIVSRKKHRRARRRWRVYGRRDSRPRRGLLNYSESKLRG